MILLKRWLIVVMNNMMNKNQASVLLIVAVVIITGVFWLTSSNSRPTYSTEALEQFATCLKDKQVTMYGAAWCPHCQEEKKNFGEAFEIVPYVECPDNIKVCLDLGIEGYPTWILASGKRLVGEQGLEKLSQETSCPLN